VEFRVGLQSEQEEHLEVGSRELHHKMCYDYHLALSPSLRLLSWDKYQSKPCDPLPPRLPFPGLPPPLPPPVDASRCCAIGLLLLLEFFIIVGWFSILFGNNFSVTTCSY
jgi:hypothetical protein